MAAAAAATVEVAVMNRRAQLDSQTQQEDREIDHIQMRPAHLSWQREQDLAKKQGRIMESARVVAHRH